MNLSTMIMSIFSFLPTLIATAEKAFSGTPGSGEAKKKLVLDSVAAGIAVVTAIEHADTLTADQNAAILGAASTLTDAHVKTLKDASAL